MLADLAQHSLVAITGDPDDVDALVRAMLLRLAFDHSPTDLSVAGLLYAAPAPAAVCGLGWSAAPDHEGGVPDLASPPEGVDVTGLLGFAPVAFDDLIDFLPIASVDFQAYPLPVAFGKRPNFFLLLGRQTALFHHLPDTGV